MSLAKKQYPVFCIVSSILILSLAVATFPVVSAQAANLNHNYPRLAHVFHKPYLSQDTIKSLKKWDVLVLSAELGYDSSTGLNSIRAQNPNVVLLSYVNTMLVTKRGVYGYDRRYNYLKLLAAEASGSPGWWLYDQYGNQVSTWSNNWNLNLSDVSPIHNGKRWAEYLADLVHNEVMRDYPWDGVFYDDAHQIASWINGGNLDLNNDRVKDSASYLNDHWSSGLQTLFSRSRANEGTGKIIIGNGGYTLYTYGNGRFFESFPIIWSGATWDGQMQEYLTWLSRGLSPRLSVISGNNAGSSDQVPNLKNMRFTLTSALLGDGYYNFDLRAEPLWFDEYSVDTNGNATGDDSAKGYLDQPKAPAYRLSNGVWRRDFDRGIVLVNPTSQTQTASLEKTYKKIKGTQAPEVNDGSYVNSVIIPGGDGIILLEEGNTDKPASLGVQTTLGEIFGRVVRRTMRMIFGTAVRAHHDAYGDWVVPTNPGGEFRISNLPSGIYTMFLDAPGYVSQIQELIPVFAGQTTKTSTVIMSRPGSIHGKVVDDAGKSIPGTAVRIDSTVMPTNLSGEYRFTLVQPGIYTMFVDGPGYSARRILVEVRAGKVTMLPTVVMSR